ncbi:MAG: hydrogenase expression/formation protein [Acidobacteria bacterium]|nr:hydrogenase expression/formation protein [Acidobacteriota bacterium]
MELMNANPVLNEIKHALRVLCERGETHTINIMNFPLTTEDMKFLDEVLGRGVITISYDGLESTFWQESKIAGVWWGEYRNAYGRVTLRTIEITEFPALAKSQPDDIMDGIRRLDEVLAENARGVIRALPVLPTS